MAHGIVSARWVSIIGAALLVSCSSASAQGRFDTPEDAISALVSAAKDGNTEKLLDILGPDGEDVISSGDEVADRNTREGFVAAYDEKHTLEAEGDDKTILVMGDNDWPFPIPIVKTNGKWTFDAAAGLEEILVRRIGRNELSAIEASLAYVAAQNDYAALEVDGKNPPSYAQRIVSTLGKKDGLYWPAAEGETPSPLGELFAEASAEGYKPGENPIPYHGYYYRILTRQGTGAEGGAYDYVVDGRMIGGFGLVAYPAQYGNSGIMTFMVNQDGVVFQKDLGPKTEKLAPKIDAFAPADGWAKIETP